MATYVDAELAESMGPGQTIRTVNIAVTGDDRAFIAAGGEDYGPASAEPDTLELDPDGTPQAVGDITTVSEGSYIDQMFGWIDDPTSVTAPVELSLTASRAANAGAWVGGISYQNAGDVTGYVDDQGTATGDQTITVGGTMGASDTAAMIACCSANPADFDVDSNTTNRGGGPDIGNYSGIIMGDRVGNATVGIDVTSATYGWIIQGARIPYAAPAGGGASRKMLLLGVT